MSGMSEEPYTLVMGSVASVCHRCGALVWHSDEARRIHDEFHARIDGYPQVSGVASPGAS